MRRPDLAPGGLLQEAQAMPAAVDFELQDAAKWPAAPQRKHFPSARLGRGCLLAWSYGAKRLAGVKPPPEPDDERLEKEEVGWEEGRRS